MHFGTLANLMVFASFSIKVNEIGSTANAAVLWSVAQIVRFSEWAPNDTSKLKGKQEIFFDRITIKEFCRKNRERNHCYGLTNFQGPSLYYVSNTGWVGSKNVIFTDVQYYLC